MVARRSIRLPCRLVSVRRVRRIGQNATACSSQVPIRRRSASSNCSNGSSARATIRLGSTSGIAAASPAASAARSDGGRVAQGNPPACGPLRVAVPGRGNRAGRQATLGSQRDRVDRQDGVGEHRLEDGVEGRQVLDAVHQRQARRPVQLDARRRHQLAHRGDERRGPAGRHRHTTGAQAGDQRGRECGQVDTAQQRR